MGTHELWRKKGGRIGGGESMKVRGDMLGDEGSEGRVEWK